MGKGHRPLPGGDVLDASRRCAGRRQLVHGYPSSRLCPWRSHRSGGVLLPGNRMDPRHPHRQRGADPQALGGSPLWGRRDHPLRVGSGDPSPTGRHGTPVGRIKGGTYSLQGSGLEYERCPLRTEVTLSQSQCPIMPIDPRRFASSVGAPSSGGKSGRTCGMRCAIAQIGVATTAIPALLQGVNPIHQANKKADPSRTAR